MLLALFAFLALDPRLETSADRKAFTLWFTWLAEAQFYLEPAQRRMEIKDCSSLARYAYRESLARHDAAWLKQNPLPAIPSLPSIGARSGPLFQTGEGLRHFADAKTLMRANTYRVGNSLEQARPGDLLFYEQTDEHESWHVMIYLGPSQFEPSSARYVVYHTGPVGKHPGEIRRLSLEELRNHPQPRWRPVPGNRAFRGVFRWKILEG